MDSRFKNITMTGRMCYIFMCMERYLLSLYPDRDWTLVAKKMCSGLPLAVGMTMNGTHISASCPNW